MESFILITKKLMGLSPRGFVPKIFPTTHFVYLIRRGLGGRWNFGVRVINYSAGHLDTIFG